MTTDHELDEEVPEGFSRVIGDVNYFKVKCKNKPKQYFLKKIENGNLSTFQIAPRHLPAGIEYEVTRCTVHDSGDNQFDIISDSCPNQIVQGFLINGNPVSSIFGMGYRTFTFNSNTASETDLSLSCDITVCTEGMCPGNTC